MGLGGASGGLALGSGGSGLGSSGLSRAGGGGGGAVVASTVRRLDLDALVGTIRTIGPHVLLSIGGTVGVVLDGHFLVVANGRALGEVGQATSPLDGTLGSLRVTGDPGTKLELAGSLRESGSALGVGVLELTNQVAINDPVNVVLRPLEGVGVSGGLRVADGREAATVEGRVVTLAEVVGLDIRGVAAYPLPVDLVAVIGLEDDTGHNTFAGRGGQLHVDLAEEDVLGARDGRGLGLLLHAEGSALAAVGELGAIGYLEVLARALGEIDDDGVFLAEGRVGSACCMAVSVSLFRCSSIPPLFARFRRSLVSHSHFSLGSHAV